MKKEPELIEEQEAQYASVSVKDGVLKREEGVIIHRRIRRPIEQGNKLEAWDGEQSHYFYSDSFPVVAVGDGKKLDAEVWWKVLCEENGELTYTRGTPGDDLRSEIFMRYEIRPRSGNDDVALPDVMTGRHMAWINLHAVKYLVYYETADSTASEFIYHLNDKIHERSGSWFSQRWCVVHAEAALLTDGNL